MSTQYYTDDCMIPVPEGYRDRTTNVLEWKTEEDDSIALVIHREPLPPSRGEEGFTAEDLDRHVARETAGYAGKFPGMRLDRDEASGPDAGFLMRRKAFRWRRDADVLYHSQAFVVAADRIIVLTAAAKARHRDAVDHMLDEAVAKFRIRGA